MQIFKFGIVFLVGLAVGMFGYEALMGKINQQERAGFIMNDQLLHVQEFLIDNKREERINYCLNFYRAQNHTHELQKKIELYKDRTVHNGFLMVSIISAKGIVEQFNAFNRKDLKHLCEIN